MTERAVGAEVSAGSVRARAEALTSALESGAGCLPGGAVAQAEAVIAKTSARTSIAGGRTVVALAGATGSGKSSLFNALAGADVALVGARRPTTSTLTAAIWGSGPSTELLDWLMVGARHIVDEDRTAETVLAETVVAETVVAETVSAQDELDGLVLLDLPDFDSQATAHRTEADRVLALVDVFIWVTDPEKYADARLHGDYIGKLSAHDAVTITVLNQADRLSSEALDACRRDLLRLLTADGLVEAEVIVTSAREGRGVDDLRHRLSSVVKSHGAAIARLDSDLRSAATLLRPGVADAEPSLDDLADTALISALGRAAGIPVILDAVERDYRRQTLALTGWPFTRWVRALKPAPLKRLGLRKDAPDLPGAISSSDVRSVLGRSSLPPATPAARAAVALATRELADQAGRELPQPWTDAVDDAAMPAGGDLADALDQAVMGTSLRARDPLWWTAFGALQWILAAAAGVGLGWLMVLTVLDWLRLPAVQTPGLGGLPYPFLLFVGGLLSGFVLSLLTRAFGRVGGRRRKDLVASRLNDSVAHVAQDLLLAPVHGILDRHGMTRQLLEAAGARQD